MTRRRAAGTLLFVLSGVLPGCRGSDAERPPARVDGAWPVMGTILRITALAADEATGRGALEAGRVAVFRVDSLMSTYKPDSEISVLNAAAGTGAWTALSPWTEEVLAASLRWARRSGGAFDPTVGPLMRAWGFRGGPKRPPDPAALATARAHVGWQAVTLDTAGHRARLERPAMALDFGGVAKGYALDRALDEMRRAWALSGMADLGGNVAVYGPAPSGDGWRLGIRHPRRTAETMGRVTLERGSVATSGDYEQMFEVEGVRYGHIMDPRTGAPARGIVAVTVAAPDGLLADVLSTTLFVMGPEAGGRLLEHAFPDGGVTALWVLDAGSRPVDRAHVVTREDSTFAPLTLELPGG